MAQFNEKQFDDSRDAAEFIVEAHERGETVTVQTPKEYSVPHMHSHVEYEVAEYRDGIYGVREVGTHHVSATPSGTWVMHSGE